MLVHQRVDSDIFPTHQLPCDPVPIPKLQFPASGGTGQAVARKSPVTRKQQIVIEDDRLKEWLVVPTIGIVVGI